MVKVSFLLATTLCALSATAAPFGIVDDLALERREPKHGADVSYPVMHVYKQEADTQSKDPPNHERKTTATRVTATTEDRPKPTTVVTVKTNAATPTPTGDDQ